MQFNFWSSTKYLDRPKTFWDLYVEGQGISKFSFSAGTKTFGVALNAIQLLVWFKIFGPAQNMLGPVEGQTQFLCHHKFFLSGSNCNSAFGLAQNSLEHVEGHGIGGT